MHRVRHDGWTPARQELFLIQLERLGIVSAAARAVGMSPKSAYALLNRSEEEQSNEDPIPSFAEAWHAAIDIGHENAVSLAIERAVEGEVRPVFYRGRQVGERRVFDYRLLARAVQLYARTRRGVDPMALTRFLNGEA
jgi:DNA-binding transcriptional regulator YdaS (Cro superfamily)